MIYIFVLCIIVFFRLVPRRLALVLLGGLGRILFVLIAKERRKALRNLRFIYNEYDEKQRRRIAENVFKNLGRNAVDVIKFQTKGAEKFFTSFADASGWAHFEKAYGRGRGVVCLSGHVGAFELLHHFMAWKGYRICVTGTQIYDKRLNRLIVKNRLGENISYVERGEHSGKEILRHLRRGNLFGVLIDQDTNVDGVFAPFLGHTAWTPAAPVKLAMKTGAAVVPFVIRMGADRKHHITIEPEIDLRDTGDPAADLVENVTRCNNVISKWIMETPEQWVWMHKRWKRKTK